MKKRISLNGIWELFYAENEQKLSDVSELEKVYTNKIKASVPSNFETELAKAGVIDAELFRGMKTRENEKLEGYDWWYKTEFTAPKTSAGERLFLSFGAVDCLAEYFVNGKRVYESDNAFIEQRFDITDFAEEGKNTLCVHIKSAMRYICEQEYNQYLANGWKNGEQNLIRKPAHSFGWDIFPRAVSGGIWRDVYLEICDGYSVSELSYYVTHANADSAYIIFVASVKAPYEAYAEGLTLRLKGVCGDSEFSCSRPMYHAPTCNFGITVHSPKLWWPYGYGEANVYDLEYELLCGERVLDSGRMNLGIRTMELLRTETMKEAGHCFKFRVNGVDIMCKGSNWVPLDAYHSRDKERYADALALFTDTHCNIVRVWGGGVYEDEIFYDYCDRHGILVWQDFCVACYAPPFEGRIAENIEKEATWVVKTLRHHPSIALWSGDNEVDELLASRGKNTGINKLSREIFPKVVALNDTGRPYLASSPYIAPEYSDIYSNAAGKVDSDIFPERHLWGARDYFKAPFYSQSRAHFVSETGYHGCPARESVEKIVDSGSEWPIYNEQWTLHSSDQFGNDSRVHLMDDQIAQLFGFRADNLDDFILASQISQAEAKKYFIERIRINKPYTSGIIWWNMLDGWPQMSDAVVDYFFKKKLAYSYIKRSQQPFALMMDEMRDWNYTLVATNDTLREVRGSYKVYDVMTKKVHAEGSFCVGANQNKRLRGIPMMYSEHAFLVIEWCVDGKKYFNHYLCGYPSFDFETYRMWLAEFEKIAEMG